jgi:hypothetical protein
MTSDGGRFALDDPTTSPLTLVPEESLQFRLGQLTLLLGMARATDRNILTIDRLAYFDFLAANPYLMLDGEDARTLEDRHRVRGMGFSPRQLSYNAVGQRFVSRRERLKHDLALLIAYGIATLTPSGYDLTPRGVELEEQMNTVYAHSYRESAAIVFRRLGKATEPKLKKMMQDWLGESWLLLDLLADVVDPETRGRPVDRTDGQ